MSNECHCVVLVHLLRARQNADHVTCLRGLLLADAWTIGARIDRLATLQGACAIHRVRVTRVGDLVGRCVRVRLSRMRYLVNSWLGQRDWLRRALTLRLDELALL